MNLQKIMIIGAIITSTFTSLAFLAALVIAYLSKDQSNYSLLVGAIIAQFSNAVSYWIGSSMSSAKKDEAIAANAQPHS